MTIYVWILIVMHITAAIIGMVKAKDELVVMSILSVIALLFLLWGDWK